MSVGNAASEFTSKRKTGRRRLAFRDPVIGIDVYDRLLVGNCAPGITEKLNAYGLYDRLMFGPGQPCF